MDHNFEEEADYVAGLLHNLGVLILAITFPDRFQSIYSKEYQNTKEVIANEKKLIGWDHAKIGAYYLWNHHISDELVDSIHWHNEPSQAKENKYLASAIQVSDQIVNELGFSGLGKTSISTKGSHKELEGWQILMEDVENVEDVEDRLEESAQRVLQSLNGIF